MWNISLLLRLPYIFCWVFFHMVRYTGFFETVGLAWDSTKCVFRLAVRK